ncbi:hypothetical protein ABT214_15590 [Micromonospora purpureochromogenes]|uniref:hypothetical protein n=1 Tax=Micromonospora purpureochromogenes TaxID=47872 RepID=UPI00332DC52B
MRIGGSTELVRRPSGSARATLLELLFDVVFVAALARASMLMSAGSPRIRSVSGALPSTRWTELVPSRTAKGFEHLLVGDGA